jgi:DNA-binding XRE family transcriptional regulator
MLTVKRMKKRGRPRNEDSRNLVRRLKSDGLSYAEIGKQLGITRQAACYYLTDQPVGAGKCEACGKQSRSLHRHHDDYSKNKTRNLCASCHSKQFRIEQNRMGLGSILTQIQTGETVRYRRIELKISQAMLASKLKISQAYLCDLEKGKRNWTNEMVSKINELLCLKLHAIH